MNRITKETKAIADAHIQARINGVFDDPQVNTKDELIAQLRAGKTFSVLMDKIEIKYTSITSIILSRQLFHQSQNYTKGIYKGFKIILQP